MSVEGAARHVTRAPSKGSGFRVHGAARHVTGAPSKG